ncbi:phosphate signaling complex protein PhoU [bacterium]|nr:phosphate signaling complex protein PhoU [bacterium]
MVKRHLHREIEKLKVSILELGALVEENLSRAIKSIETEDLELAELVISSDQDIDRKEVELEEECLKILALYQPVASDLRFIIFLVKINNDLERVGDLALNIAQRVDYIKALQEKPMLYDILIMAQKSRKMLKNSLDAFVNLDTKLAKEVCAADDEVDEINRRMNELTREEIIKHPDQFPERVVQLLAVSRDLERIADHATNIAEGVVYLVDGVIMRHKMKDYLA